MRNSGSTKKQAVQFNVEGECLYTFSGLFQFRKNIVENRNFDICVANCRGEATVWSIMLVNLDLSTCVSLNQSA